MQNHLLSSELHCNMTNYDFSLCTIQLFDSIWKGGERTTIQTLLQAGVDLNAKIRGGCTALHVAVVKSSKTIVELLIDSGADVNARDDEQWTVLHFAAQCGSVEMAQYLLTKGVDIDAKIRGGCTALHVAVLKSSKPVVELLVDSGADLNARDDEQWTVLHYAAQYGCKEVVQHLLEKGSDINEVTSTKNSSALHIAIANKQIDIVKLLISCGADVNQFDCMKDTALHFASIFNLVEVMESLVSKGADLDAINHRSVTPLYYAVRNKTLNTTRLLLGLGADYNINIQNENSISIFSYLIKVWPNIDAVKLCIENGAYFKSNDYNTIMKNPALKKTILQDIHICSREVINKFNSLDLPELYKIPFCIESLPPMNRLKIGPHCKGTVLIIDQTVQYEIKRNGHCNSSEVFPMSLTFLCVKSFKMYYDGLNNVMPLPRKSSKRKRKSE